MSRHHHRHQHRRILFASVIIGIMSMVNRAVAAPFASLRRVGLAPASSLSLVGNGASNNSAFVSQYRYNTRRPIAPRDATKAFVSSDKRSFSGVSPTKSMLALCSGEGGDSTAQIAVTQEEGVVQEDNHFHCYLLRSVDPDHPLKTYIGFTTNPQRRLRQHNGEITGGARRTAKQGRPWEYVAVIDGFQDKVTAMQFEWAWQHVGRSKVFREAVGCDKLARKMKRKRGVKARLDELDILLNDCPPFNTFPLDVYFLETEHHDLFCDLSKGTDNLSLEICSLDDMPFAVSVGKEVPITKRPCTNANSLEHIPLSLNECV
mmetsp:Transcript_16807/g.36273  ORF Transcript_16807/g.36273 Transcript_16807/m.36273 type:complete len:318 (+) Transcript_16807:81-1034(+)